jgi:hypothetical protein
MDIIAARFQSPPGDRDFPDRDTGLYYGLPLIFSISAPRLMRTSGKLLPGM